jgi:secondary thiamine-phosphate synthase enzyme
MKVTTTTLSVHTQGHTDIVDLTPRVEEALKQSGVREGTVTVFVSGSTAALTTIEYESGVLEDLKQAIARMAPEGIPYAHDRRWGDGNGYAHVRAALLGPSLAIPVVGGGLALGAWQQIVLLDFDNRARKREILLQILGE